jgi:hypothetical protein
MQVSGTLAAAAAAGTRGFGHNVLALTGTNVTTPVLLLWLSAADYAVSGLASKLRVRAQLATNAVAPSGNWTVGLHPVSAVAGATGGLTYTIGAAVTGSTVVFTAPAAGSRLQGQTVDFTPPADGFYALGLVTSAAVATSSFVAVAAWLQTRNV